MNLRLPYVILLLWVYIVKDVNSIRKRFSVSRGFLLFGMNSLTDRACNCQTTFSCSCCEQVIILYQNAWKPLCVNFTYQRNGLNVDITLNSNIIKTRTVTNYRPFRMCTPVPGCIFSTVCANIIELNEFPRSITACLRTDILTKKQLWKLTYNCISVSTELPMNVASMSAMLMGSSPMTTTQTSTKLLANTTMMTTKAMMMMTTMKTMMTMATTSMMMTAVTKNGSTQSSKIMTMPTMPSNDTLTA